MKIGIVGCGALGSYYGAKLCRDGQEVHFLLRSDYEVVRRRGVEIISDEGNFHVNPKCAQRPEDIGICDVVLIGLKTTANHQFAKLLPPLIGENTAILTLQNGLGNEEQLAALFGGEKVLGGLCYVCVNRVGPGKIHHVGDGKIVMGEFKGWPEPRTHDIASMIRHSGVPCVVSESIAKSRWEKLVWNIPFNGLGVAGTVGYEAVLSGHLPPDAKLGPCLPTNILLEDQKWETLVTELMFETIAVANALGLKVPEATAEQQIARTRPIGAYKASTVVDFERGLALESDSLFFEPLRQAEKAGVATPRLKNLCTILTALDAMQRKPTV
ncbi:MAG: 2-dehydropantoate 2-reductase [Verrucomicrobiales bacterium]|nr:2-dehydropantoate 2-reductase [Verrucomicrobiales bacterium]